MKTSRTFLRISLAVALLLIAAISPKSNVSAQGTTPPCYTLNGRDFSGITTQYYDGFSWMSIPSGQVYGYSQANAISTSVHDSSLFPTATTQANIPVGTYRVWIYQMGGSGDRSLHVTVGNDSPVYASFGVQGSVYMGWVDVGTHQVGPTTTIAVSADAELQYHGQPMPERRGGFKSIYLTTDLSSTPLTFAPDGQTTCVAET
ncbi:MAG: hypothetical protein ACD_34C00125G0003 [uncultured bacterium]|nr:MAG: hypothetical protein ACD_34C00125G0003 [uncultured bacterium]